ncbi:class I SAM-dependent DNA methyltransferase [Paracoccus sp. 11-3]|uniref:site-specific DNA-methyltransferase (adenine-specific) n=1 Tax=Paracoccus amoyensis TaxID=2760093 RepID=A0A926GE72_9RHOB|nr:class I SAM-dependent DNA methyltransferase [Paracoccus amoyensis]MBC9247530.1 class I SAM-dependent DNA methyltransferase [Paracoccus amoyensis]
MNAVEIEEAISQLAEQPFEAAEFPYAFLLAFGNKDTTIKRLRAGNSNKSDLGGVLQTSNIHIKTCAEGEATVTLRALRESPATARAKAKFILATDGVEFQAEDLTSGEAIICPYADFPNHFGFFLSLAGITTVRAIRENAFDIKATGRLNRLYIELLKDNPEWGAAARRHEMNQFMARLIFCFFAEDTGIFAQETVFTRTIDTMSARDSSNTHEVIGELFRAMNTRAEDRAAAGILRWADPFPYVNGELFSGTTEAPRFSRIARSYLLTIGGLDWTRVNPDIFGSMIQAVADEEERGALGMHYTSVPNILKVLNPLFLDDLRAALEEAGDNSRKLLNLRGRMARIRVFDPACGSGNFLVIAYKELRAIEAEISRRRGEADRRSEITLTNFRGIELRDFPATIARLALIIAEYQCDVLHRGQREATRDFLPLDSKNWITCGNALRLDWLSICPPTGTGVKLRGEDLFATPLDQAEIDFENEGGEIFICANPPYQGSVNQTPSQKDDMARIFSPVLKTYKDLDYVAAFVLKVAQFNRMTGSKSALVTTNSVTQGEQVAMLWPLVFSQRNVIHFAHTSFLWSNLASNKAAVTCVIVGLSPMEESECHLFDNGVVRSVRNIGPYLVAGDSVIVKKRSAPLSGLSMMQSGNKPTDGGNLILSSNERSAIASTSPASMRFMKRYVGSREIINGGNRWCIWIEDDELNDAKSIPEFRERLERVRRLRETSNGKQANDNAASPHRFVFAPHSRGLSIMVPNVSSEQRQFLPCNIADYATVVSNLASVIYDAPLWNMALIASRLHLVWIGTVCGKMKTDFRYSNTLGWNTFPVPPLIEKQKSDLTACAEAILLAREAHFPATIADLYDPENMPDNLRAAHDHNDEVLERIYIGRRFRNDTERLEHLFSLYTKMTTKPKAVAGGV